jgi:hypothetical protein
MPAFRGAMISFTSTVIFISSAISSQHPISMQRDRWPTFDQIAFVFGGGLLSGSAGWLIHKQEHTNCVHSVKRRRSLRRMQRKDPLLFRLLAVLRSHPSMEWPVDPDQWRYPRQQLHFPNAKSCHQPSACTSNSIYSLNQAHNSPGLEMLSRPLVLSICTSGCSTLQAW